MAVLSWTTEVTGFEGIIPKLIYIDTNDTFATITAAGYLNPSVEMGMEFTNDAMALVMSNTGPLWLQTSLVGSNHSLVSPSNSTNVILPTIANHIATYTNTIGTLSEDPVTAISGGNIQAGLSGVAGGFISYPATMTTGTLRLTATSSAGDFATFITNASQAASRTYTIPDAGASSSFLLTNNATTQTIATGNLALTVGTLTLGSSGHASSLTIFPGTAANGTLIISPVNNAGNFNTTISSVTGLGQSTIYTFPDPGAATANVLLSASGGTQTIATGNLALTVGTLTLGSSGNASSLQIFPITANNGSFSIIPLNIAGNFTVTLSNASIGQSTVYSLPDAGAATSNIAVTTGATVANNFVMASGVAGQITDSGIPVAGLQLNASGTISDVNFQGMYATPVQLIPAPAAGFGIVVFSAYLEIVFATAAPANGGAIIFQYGNTIHGAGVNTIANGGTLTIAAAFATGAAVNQWTTLENGTNIGTTASSTTTALGVFLSNDTGAFTANGGTSSIRYAVNYMIVPMV